MKKIIGSMFFISILLVFLCSDVYASTNNVVNKKIVSLVFDNSGSMSGTKAEYANYALQSMISMLDKNDELNIVKMSTPYDKDVMDISTKASKQSSIITVSEINSTSGTPFQAVDTARDWLIERKNTIASGAEYWYIIITDGQFDRSVDMSQYMENINSKFKGLKFNGIFVGIGEDVSEYHLKEFATVSNCSSKKIDTASKIIPTMFEISSKINSGEDTQVVNAKKIDNNKITVEFSVPITKMNIFVQKNNLAISSIESESGEKIDFDTYNIATKNKNAKMNEVVTKSGYLKSGKYIISFNNGINLNETQIKLFVRPAVTNEMKLYKKVEESYIELTEEDYFTLNENDELIAKSKLVSIIDGSILDLNSLEQVTGNYYINDKKINGRIENKEFVANIDLELGNNEIYSLINADGYVKEKSNIEIINLINIENVQIQYNNENDYVRNGEITLPAGKNITNIALTNLPEGIAIEYDGTNYRNNEKIILSQNKNLVVKANKNYRDEEYSIINITANENGIFNNTKTNKNYFKISPKTTKYDVVKVDETQDTVDLKEGIVKFYVQYSELDGVKKLAVENVEKVKAFEASNGYILRAYKNIETDEFEVKVIPTILSLFNDREVKFKINASIEDDLGEAFGEFEFIVINIDLLEVLLPYIIAILVISIILGYIFKNRFNKNAYFKISSEEQPYLIKDYSVGLRKYLPFVSDVALLPELEVKAKGANKIQVLSSSEEILEVNGEVEIPKRIILNLNSGELVLNVNNKKIKYEYITLTMDEIVEKLENESKDDEMWI